MDQEFTDVLSGLLGCGFVIAILGVMIFIWWRIFSKTGNSPWLSLLMLVPLANLGAMLYLAFSEWPVHQRIKELEAELQTKHFE